LRALRPFPQFLAEEGCPICTRLLRVELLDEGQPLPRDVPPEQLARLLDAIESEANSPHSGARRAGRMDRAWFLLMLHSGLRRLPHLDLKGRRVRVEQSKGLKDRVVCLGESAVEALRTYLEIRGPAAADHVFIYCHRPLSRTYCHDRLETYGRRCGVRVTPHQLRHSCATLLLNSGAPILTVQKILGHKFVDTTLRYARLYDGAVAADYYRAMGRIETRMELQEANADSPPTAGRLLALVDALRDGTLNENQRETIQALRDGILALAEQTANL
jgi:integrase